jgi:hypothetical protein
MYKNGNTNESQSPIPVLLSTVTFAAAHVFLWRDSQDILLIIALT